MRRRHRMDGWLVQMAEMESTRRFEQPTKADASGHEIAGGRLRREEMKRRCVSGDVAGQWTSAAYRTGVGSVSRGSGQAVFG
jgi:hypothetical protein